MIEYCGELISNHVADFREKEYNIRGFGDCYLFRLDSNQIVSLFLFRLMLQNMGIWRDSLITDVIRIV